MTPLEIAHYRIVSVLGQGGMGVVYRATDTKLNRDVALKMLPDSFAADPERLARWQREAHVLASLKPPEYRRDLRHRARRHRDGVGRGREPRRTFARRHTEKSQISANGGSLPVWRKDGKELFFLDASGTVMSVEMSLQSRIQAAGPKPLFHLSESSLTNTLFWPIPDGQRFLVIERGRSTSKPVPTVVVNWTADLRQGGT